MAAVACVGGASSGGKTVGRLADGAAGPGAYPVLVRLSDVPGEPLKDSVATRRGPPVKGLDVQGPMPPGHEGGTAQSFLLDGGDHFPGAGAAQFLATITGLEEAIGPTTRRRPVVSVARSTGA